MKTTDLWQTYDAYTSGITEQSRKLAFAAAAICWFFNSDEVTFPLSVMWALIFVVVFFLLDIGQYLSGALLTRYWTRGEEIRLWREEGSIDGDVEKPDWLDRPPFLLFLLKIASLSAAFIALLTEFVGRIS